MTGKQRIIEVLKSILVVLLLLFLALQFLTYWLMGTDAASFSSDSILRKVYTYFNRGALGYEVRVSGVSAVEPVQIALMTPDGGNGVQYNKADIGISIVTLQAVTSSAFLNAKTFTVLEEDVLLEKLTTDESIVLHYFHAAPLSAIASGLQATSRSEMEAVSIMLFVQDQLLVVRDKEGNLFVSNTKMDINAFEEVKKEFSGLLQCQIAGSDYLVIPETLLFDEESLKFPVIEAVAVDPLGADSDASLKMLLEAFSYTSRAGYTEKNDSVYVFSDKFSTLRITNEGQVDFRASKEQSTIVAFEKGEVADSQVLTAQLSTTYAILETALHAVGSEAQPMFSRTSKDADGATRITFMQTYNGVPVMEQTEFASLVFYDNVLGAATVNLELLLASQDTSDVIVFPARPAAATAEQINQRMVIAYCGQPDAFTAQRVFAIE